MYIFNARLWFHCSVHLHNTHSFETGLDYKVGLNTHTDNDCVDTAIVVGDEVGGMDFRLHSHSKWSWIPYRSRHYGD